MLRQPQATVLLTFLNVCKSIARQAILLGVWIKNTHLAQFHAHHLLSAHQNKTAKLLGNMELLLLYLKTKL